MAELGVTGCGDSVVLMDGPMEGIFSSLSTLDGGCGDDSIIDPGPREGIFSSFKLGKLEGGGDEVTMSPSLESIGSSLGSTLMSGSDDCPRG